MFLGRIGRPKSGGSRLGGCRNEARRLDRAHRHGSAFWLGERLEVGGPSLRPSWSSKRQVGSMRPAQTRRRTACGGVPSECHDAVRRCPRRVGRSPTRPRSNGLWRRSNWKRKMTADNSVHPNANSCQRPIPRGPRLRNARRDDVLKIIWSIVMALVIGGVARIFSTAKRSSFPRAASSRPYAC